MTYDPASFGMLTARERIAEEYGVDVSRVILTASTSEAYSWLFKLLCDPGDEVLVPRPSYPLFDYLAALEGVVVKPYHLRYSEGWFVDVADIRITEWTRAIVVVNPNNPTGSYLKPAELEALVKLARSHDLAIISDEVFSDYALEDGAVRSLVGVEGAVTFCLNGLSKLVGLPQMKLGWMIANDQASIERLEIIADTYLVGRHAGAVRVAETAGAEDSRTGPDYGPCTREPGLGEGGQACGRRLVRDLAGTSHEE